MAQGVRGIVDNQIVSIQFNDDDGGLCVEEKCRDGNAAADGNIVGKHDNYNDNPNDNPTDARETRRSAACQHYRLPEKSP